MNPLTIKARHNLIRQSREDLLISLACGVVFAALNIAFFL